MYVTDPAELKIIRGKSRIIQQDVEVLNRVLAILDCLDGNQALSLTEITECTGLAKATCFRLLQAMQSQHLVRQDGRYYGLGSRLFSYVYAHLMMQPIGRIGRPVLRQLRTDTGLTAALCVRQGAFRVVIALEEGDQGETRFVDVGQVGVIYAGSPSKVLLAWLSKAERDAILADVQFVPITSQTIVCREVLELECARIREQGFALSRGERDPYAFSISVPIRSHAERVVAALTLTGPLKSLNESSRLAWADLLLQAGSHLSRLLGEEQETSDC